MISRSCRFLRGSFLNTISIFFCGADMFFRLFVYRKLLAGQHAFLHKSVVVGDLSAARPQPRFEYGKKEILEGIPASF